MRKIVLAVAVIKIRQKRLKRVADTRWTLRARQAMARALNMHTLRQLPDG